MHCYVNKGVIDTVFTGRIKEFESIGDFVRVVPEVAGAVQIMGFNNSAMEPEDTLPEGFRITGAENRFVYLATCGLGPEIGGEAHLVRNYLE
ncbi:hypothetical protein SBF1_610028 [Candidatus Desulfosporosinus infrequens]|uniref:Uncharacterized protein n=1 Tax=Candidatus Desulfosporosinus infrequens TaxID=2043169 RepID=A0A2U3LLJ4_9FIRM|nr:hypothetical protein SBF1_610028 [Candidatus Desulfosporosinus infrequens]